MGETQQPLSKRVHQHTHSVAGRPNSAVLDHMCATGHVLDLDSFMILNEKQIEAKGYKRSYLRETGGSRVKQEWWIALYLGQRRWKLFNNNFLRVDKPCV